MEPIILASSSPRRQEILKRLDIPFVVNPPNIDESIPKGMPLDKVSEYLASKKVEAVVRSVSQVHETSWVLGADTTIILNKKIYGKPENQDEAFEFIKKFQGTTHKVVSSLALFNGELHYLSTRTSINKVTFSPMTDKEIEWYISTGEWHGAAGGYRIQESASLFIKKIEGTESSIMGLPIIELYDILREQNYNLLQ